MKQGTIVLERVGTPWGVKDIIVDASYDSEESILDIESVFIPVDGGLKLENLEWSANEPGLLKEIINHLEDL